MAPIAIPLGLEVLLSALLFAVGVFGVLRRSNAILIILSVEIMLNAAIMNFVAFGTYNQDPAGHAFALLLIAASAAEVAIGLAILLNLFRVRNTIEVTDIHLMSG